MPGSWLGWGQGEQSWETQPNLEEMGKHLGLEGEKVLSRQGRKKELYARACKKQRWKVGTLGRENTTRNFPSGCRGKAGGGVQIPLCGDTSCSLAGTCLNTKQRILDHPVQSEPSEDQVTGTPLAGLEDPILLQWEFSEEGRGQAVLRGFTVKSCGNIFTAQLKHHFLLGACPDPST